MTPTTPAPAAPRARRAAAPALTVMPSYRRGGRGGVYVFDAADAPWQPAGKNGIVQKVIRRDDERGQFLGMIGMEPMVRSGLHQHQGVATSFFVDGGLTDYQGPIGLHQAGINLKGATHDAIAWARTLFVARLEAPVTYPPQDGPLHGLHAGARHAHLVNPDPALPPDINVTVDALPTAGTGCDGVLRRTVFDYAPTADDHRMVQLSIRPQARIPRLLATGHTELWVRGGLLEVDGRVAGAGCFVIVEPQTEVSLASPFGALVLGWAEGPVHWVDPPGPAAGERAARADLFGYR
jgi:hypothetical protein